MRTDQAVADAQFLTFTVGREEYAIEVLRVREVVEAMPVTRVPTAPSPIRGVVNLRGSVVPLVDLGARFGLGELEITKWTCVVFVEVDQGGVRTIMGMLVDSVRRVVELAADAIEPVPPFGTQVRLEFLRGVGVLGDQFVLLLDVDRVLEMNDLLAASDAAATGDATAADAAGASADAGEP